MPVFAAFFALSACALPAQRIDDAILNAWTHNQSLPLAHIVDETLTIERAYAIQTRTVRERLRGEQPIGFKAGLTSSASQARFGASGPIAGILFPESRATSRAFRLSDARGLHIETEVAMRIGKPIERRLARVEELRDHIDGIAAAIELPNLDYEDADQLTALDIVATNIAAHRFIVADFVAPAARDANELSTALQCDGETLNNGAARDAMGDQWQAALWLVNTMIEQGWDLRPGQILLTGALGKMIRARPGRCIADFGDWGRIEFALVE